MTTIMEEKVNRSMGETAQTFESFMNNGEPPLDYEKQLLLTDENKQRVLAILDGKNIPPYEVEIQTSPVCNLKCKHCFGRDYDKLPAMIGLKEMRTIAERINDFERNGFNIRAAKFCGTTGEPLVNPVTLYGIRLFKEQGRKVIVFTNGLNLTTRLGNGNRYFNVLGEADKINLSLDAGSAKTFYKLKGIEGFEQVMRGLEGLVATKGEKNSSQEIRVSYVVGRENYHEVEETARRMNDMGASGITFRVDFTDLDFVREHSEEILESFERAKKYATKDFKVVPVYSDEVISHDDSGFNSQEKCFNKYFWACIGPDAKLYACGHRTYGGIESYGNLLEHSFEELWDKREKDFKFNPLPDDKCINCSPSSIRRNKFMNFLAGLSRETAKELIYSA